MADRDRTGCNWTVHAAEFIAVYKAAEIIDKEIANEICDETDQEKIITIISDSQCHEPTVSTYHFLLSDLFSHPNREGDEVEQK